ncbi:MAG: methylated-DNA-[protein]-cysteine S-methyltransferase [Solirubrobacteraceae bacterium]|nr:methylated-DNA/protein-cysteine methyltransferase [Solirubrobacterales bacterium]MEA2215906.1 methylated-DNA-[protein]-cysteine S-methyltransferase [Solirubrobacteraceae bacterium]
MSPATAGSQLARRGADPLAAALYTRVESPVGALLLAGDERALWAVWMDGQRWSHEIRCDWRTAAEPFAETTRQLGEYFAGERRVFDLPLRMRGSEFRRTVWAALRRIPFAQTCSYGEIAHTIGRPGAARAVGLANGRNPFAIIVPCHRVIGSTGSLVGYAGGLERKRWLLAHERGSIVSTARTG